MNQVSQLFGERFTGDGRRTPSPKSQSVGHWPLIAQWTASDRGQEVDDSPQDPICGYTIPQSCTVSAPRSQEFDPSLYAAHNAESASIKRDINRKRREKKTRISTMTQLSMQTSSRTHRKACFLVFDTHVCCGEPHCFDCFVERDTVHAMTRHRELGCRNRFYRYYYQVRTRIIVTQ